MRNHPNYRILDKRSRLSYVPKPVRNTRQKSHKRRKKLPPNIASIRFDPGVLARASEHARSSGRTFSDVVRDLVLEWLGEATPERESARIRLLTLANELPMLLRKVGL